MDGEPEIVMPGKSSGDKARQTVRTVIAGVIVILALLVFVVVNPIVIVRAGFRGVILEWGAVSDRILGEGIHWVTPIKNSVVKVDVTIQKVAKDVTAASRDLQTVHAKIALNYRPEPESVNKIYQSFRKDYAERVVEPTIDEFVKKTTAHYTAEELITKRELVKGDLKKSITEALLASRLIVTDVYMTDFDFSKEFNSAIEAKVKAEQDALKERNNLEAVKFRAQQQIASAEAAARAIKIQAEAITQQGGKDFVHLKAIEKWDGKLPQQMIPGGAVPFINVSSTR